MVVQHRVNGDQAFLWQNSTPHRIKTPNRLITNFEYMRYAPISTFVKISSMGAFVESGEI